MSSRSPNDREGLKAKKAQNSQDVAECHEGFEKPREERVAGKKRLAGRRTAVKRATGSQEGIELKWTLSGQEGADMLIGRRAAKIASNGRENVEQPGGCWPQVSRRSRV